jgi:SPFH domain/Band 7 family protein
VPTGTTRRVTRPSIGRPAAHHRATDEQPNGSRSALPPASGASDSGPRRTTSGCFRQILDVTTAEWGVEVTLVELKDIQLPDSMRRAMAKQAEAEREKRAKIINAEGESLAKAPVTMATRSRRFTPFVQCGRRWRRRPCLRAGRCSG